ncbi:MAG: hypothetical protein DMD82_03725 [Candidatus Rokuibacteriota bacterium]|nr:MAG: hypothetical protein DMD82_03725 [Candidatus Rokubacteria bacterium]
MLGTSRIPHAAVGACVALGALLGIPSAYGGPPRLDHVIVVILENHSYDQVRAKPYIASLMASGATFSGSYAVTHPSQPNYLALWSGGTQGISDDACPAPGSPFMAENLGHACERKGLTWKAYSENLPSAGSTACSANSGKYTRKHDPWTDFGNLNHQNERGYADLAADIGRELARLLCFDGGRMARGQCAGNAECNRQSGRSHRDVGRGRQEREQPHPHGNGRDAGQGGFRVDREDQPLRRVANDQRVARDHPVRRGRRGGVGVGRVELTHARGPVDVGKGEDALPVVRPRFSSRGLGRRRCWRMRRLVVCSTQCRERRANKALRPRRRRESASSRDFG